VYAAAAFVKKGQLCAEECLPRLKAYYTQGLVAAFASENGRPWPNGSRPFKETVPQLTALPAGSDARFEPRCRLPRSEFAGRFAGRSCARALAAAVGLRVWRVLS